MPPVSSPGLDCACPASVARTVASMTTCSNTTDLAVRPRSKGRRVEGARCSEPDVGRGDRALDPDPMIGLAGAAIKHFEHTGDSEDRSVLGGEAGPRPRRGGAA